MREATRKDLPKGSEACILSTHTPSETYARIKRGGRMVLEHRWVWEQANGPIPDGMIICHTCDVPRCIRLEHLFLGTQSDNMRDAAQKGRLWQNQKTHCPKGHEYIEENVRIYRGGRNCRECGRENYRRWYRAQRGDEGRPPPG